MLTAIDRRMLERFLEAHPPETMFLRSNLAVGAITDEPQNRYDGAYVGAFDGGLLVGVACHVGNGMLLGHGSGLDRATAHVVAATGAPVRGLTAELAAVGAMLEGLPLDDAHVQLDSREVLYSLVLDELVRPPALDQGLCRLPTADELDLLTSWREAYSLETMGVVWGSPRDVIQGFVDREACRVFEVDGQLVSYCHLNAEAPGMVQIGGVWTPPELRGQGYARAVVAGCLLDARDDGVEIAVLFTPHANRAAQRAYEALGFEVIGDTRLVIFDPPLTTS